MADRDRAQPHQVQLRRYDGGLQAVLPKGPSPGQVLAVVALLPLVVTLIGLAGIILFGTLIGLTVTTPLFVIFSTVLVPATLVVGLSVAGFLFSGTFDLTGLSSFSWVLNFFKSKYSSMVYGAKFVQIGL